LNLNKVHITKNDKVFKSNVDVFVISALYHKLRQTPKLKVALIEKRFVCLSGEHCNVDTLWFKVKITPVSPIEIEPIKMVYFHCVVFL